MRALRDVLVPAAQGALDELQRGTDAVILPMLTGLAAAAAHAPAPDGDRIEAWAADQRTRTGRLHVALPFFLAAGTAP